MILKNSKTLNIVFAGTNDFSKNHLKVLIKQTSHKILGIITQPDKPYGRGQNVVSTPTKILAKKFNIPVFQPISLNTTEFYNQILNLNADIMIVVSYGKIIPQTILKIFPLGGINIHTSLLPKWRGPSPIQSSILYGDKLTGITIIKMSKNIDTGNIIYSSPCIIKNTDTCSTLQKRLQTLSCKILTKILIKFLNNSYYSIHQSKLTKYSKKIKKTDAKLLWSTDAIKLERLIRAYNPWPICYFTINKKLSIKVWSANVISNLSQYKYKTGEIILINKYGIQIKTKKNILNIQQVQLPGKKIMLAKNLCHPKYPWCKPGIQLK
ncbi:MAG: methionyl-tRNA formyltransferase [Buchnera aphidicola (Chaetogeoica yunlongensis)]